MTKKKSGGRAIALVVALALVAPLLLGGLVSLGDKRGEGSLFTPTPELALEKLTTLKLWSPGVNPHVTAASYVNGTHLVAYSTPDGSTPTKLMTSTDGKTWTNVLANPSVANMYPYNDILDEIVYKDDIWFFGFFGWNNSSDGFIFRFIPGQDGSVLGGSWGSTFNGSLYSSGRFTWLGVVDDTLYTVSEHGAIYYKTKGGAWNPVRGEDYKPFAGYKVTDVTKCGNKYVALGTSEEETVLFYAYVFDGYWYTKKLDVEATRLESSGNAVFLACNDGTLAYFKDMTNWSYSKMPDRNVDFTEFFAFKGKYYAIGSSDDMGVLYESINGGASWERVCATSEPLSAVSVATDEAFLYGENGGIYRLTIK